ncbi:MAG: YlmC/YmxH family sporulation protein [Oscillospiraceae bacterium]
MVSKFGEFKNKEIIDLVTGTKIGYVDDIVFDSETATISAVVIYGRLRFFGLFGRNEDLLFDWSDIETIGRDTILIKAQNIKNSTRKPHSNFFDKIFG